MNFHLLRIVSGALVVIFASAPGSATLAAKQAPSHPHRPTMKRPLLVKRLRIHTAALPANCTGPVGSDAFVGGNDANDATGSDAAVLGGSGNNACDEGAGIGAGTANAIFGSGDGSESFIAAGVNNTISGGASIIGAGYNNNVPGYYSSIVAGQNNVLSGNSSSIGAGQNNSISSSYASVAAGLSNVISSSGQESLIGAGQQNTVDGGYSMIGAGGLNVISGASSLIGAGGGNTINGAGYAAFIGAGGNNRVTNAYSAVVGGSKNNVSAQYAAVAGGYNNLVSGEYGAIGGGYNNVANGIQATVGGGFGNAAMGRNAVIPGGAYNVAGGLDSFAAGNTSHASYDGTFVWSDYSATSGIASTGPNQFLARAAGGFYLYSSSSSRSGVRLAPGSGSWSSLSDRAAKMAIVSVDGAGILAKVAALPLSEWSYTAQGAGVRHLGPMAQDFRAAFGLGEDDRHITTIDEEGVALAAIKALQAEVSAKDRQLAEIRRTDEAKFDAKYARLEHRVDALEVGLKSPAAHEGNAR